MRRDALAQSYLLFGESRKARRYIGEKLLALLEGEPQTLIDGRVFEADAEGTIGIDQAREIIQWLWQTPVRSQRKSVFIAYGEALTREAQNALLKIVEEPPKAGLIIISVNDYGTIVPALTSRMDRVYVSPAYEPAVAETESEHEIEKLGSQFVRGDGAARKKIISDLLKSEQDLAPFIAAVLAACRVDTQKHWRLMAAVTSRWAAMSQWNTNKKLQLETLLEL